MLMKQILQLINRKLFQSHDQESLNWDEMSSIVSCYVIHFVAFGKLLMHSWLLVRNDFQNRDEFKVLNIVKNSISNCWDCFFFFTCWLFFHLLTIPIKDRVQVFSIVNNSNPYCWYPFSFFITKMNLLGFFFDISRLSFL